MKVVRVHEYGGPEVMKLDELATPQAGAGQALIKVEVTGVNFIDIYQRSGQYRGSLPFALGGEGAGVVEAVGPNVSEVKVGDRVAWTAAPGSYASHVVAPAAALVKLPEGLKF